MESITYAGVNLKLLRKAKKYVRRLFKLKKSNSLLYHNFKRTESVVKMASRIARHYKLSRQDYIVVVISSWFLDVGYLIGSAGHEKLSADNAAVFLSTHHISTHVIGQVKKAIQATLTQSPQSFIERILCDANSSYVGRKGFGKRSRLFRKENQLLNKTPVSKLEWRTRTIDVLLQHTFFTEYASIRLTKRKQKNLNKLTVKMKA